MKVHFRLLLFIATLSLPAVIAAADQEARVLTNFREEKSAEKWVTVNDGVMGGRSDGDFAITEDHHLSFHGDLSLENNGGFASVRSQALAVRLQPGDTIILRVRGDGRNYEFNLYPTTRRTAFSYRAGFKTTADDWTEIRLPLNKFKATSYGQVVRNRPLVPTDITGVGILIADKKAGPFQLEVDTIRVLSGNSRQ